MEQFEYKVDRNVQVYMHDKFQVPLGKPPVFVNFPIVCGYFPSDDISKALFVIKEIKIDKSLIAY